MRLNKRGFSLVELIVVVAIFGVVSMVVLDLYLNVQRSTISSEEVVEVQQGMRLALEQVARDIQMAGFLVPTETPITDARNNLITMETASAFNSFARIAAPGGANTATKFLAGGSAAVTINVGNAAMARLFTENSSYVRIVNPMSGVQLGAFKVIGVNPPTPSLRLEPLASLSDNINFVPGDMIVHVPSPADDATYPNVVTYSLGDYDPVDPNMKLLNRTWKMGTDGVDIIATNISALVIKPGFSNMPGLRFEYLMEDGTTQPSPTAAAGTALTAAQLERIVAVRIFLTGRTENAKGENKIREIKTTVKIRNN